MFRAVARVVERMCNGIARPSSPRRSVYSLPSKWRPHIFSLPFEERAHIYSLPFKGRAGVGMGYVAKRNFPVQPHPHPNPPLEGEGSKYEPPLEGEGVNLGTKHGRQCGHTSALGRRPLHWLAPLLALALTACAPLEPYSPLTRPSSGPIEGAAAEVAPASHTTLSPPYAQEAARRKTAEHIGQLIAQRYYDPGLNGVDWAAAREHFVPRAAAAQSDAAFYAELKAMVNTLRDSHTQVLTPRETVDRRRFAATRIGLLLKVVEGQVVIADVEPDSPAARADMRVGDVVRALGAPQAPTRIDTAFVRAAQDNPPPADGKQNDPVLRAVQNVLRPLLGAPDPAEQSVYFELEQADALTRRLTLTPDRVVRAPVAQLRWLEGDIAVIAFTRFAPELRRGLEQALDAAARARAVVIDLRGNSGGLVEQYLWFAGQFSDIAEPAMRELNRSRSAQPGAQPGAQRESELRIGPGKNRRRGALMQPLAILIDARTASAAELTTVTLRELRSALVLGEPSCGCVVAVPAEHILPDGGGLRIAETGFRSLRGVRMEGNPTEPNVRVTPTLTDLRTGRDVVLQEAHRRLLERLRTGSFELVSY